MMDEFNKAVSSLKNKRYKVYIDSKSNTTPGVESRIADIESARRAEITAEREKIAALQKENDQILKKIKEHEHNIACINEEADLQIEDIYSNMKLAQYLSQINSDEGKTETKESNKSDNDTAHTTKDITLDELLTQFDI